MVIDFTYQNPTRIHFGRNALDKLADELNLYGSNVLLVYGKNSIKQIGLYDKVINILAECRKQVIELAGINSNPRYSQVMEGARIVRENSIDLILAVGGGSVIDCCKGISMAAYCKEDAWQKYWINREPLANPVVPVGTILTMAGTGSEMNSGSVITNEEKHIKQGVVQPLWLLSPKFSILNPEFTYSVPKIQMVSGIFDTFSHLMEQYCSGDDDCTSDYLIEGLMRSLIVSARKAIVDAEDYEARSNIMWCATMGLNRILGVSKSQDWEPHNIEHQLGAYTDCPHGVGLAIISPAYYRLIYKFGLHRFVRFARNIWDVSADFGSDDEIALEGIRRFESFIHELGMPHTLREIGATKEMLPKIAETALKTGGYHNITTEEILQVLKESY